MDAHERGDASAVERTELLRATRRGRPNLLGKARALLDVGGEVRERAGLLGPGERRSLEALHLASALTLAADLEGIVTYDVRLRDAALAMGLTVVAPA